MLDATRITPPAVGHRVAGAREGAHSEAGGGRPTMIELIEEFALRESPWRLQEGLSARPLKKGNWKYRNWRRLSYCSNAYWMAEFHSFAPDLYERAKHAVPLDEDAILLEDSQRVATTDPGWDETTLAYWRYSRHPRNLIAPHNFIERATWVVHGQPLQARRAHVWPLRKSLRRVPR